MSCSIDSTSGTGTRWLAAEAADLALNAALLMRARLAGQTERRFEAIVRAHRDEPVGLHTAPTLQDLRDRGLQIVMADEIEAPPNH